MNHYLDHETAVLWPTRSEESRVVSGGNANAEGATVALVVRDGSIVRTDGPPSTTLLIARYASPEELRMVAHVYSTLASRMEAIRRAQRAAKRGTDAPPDSPGG